MTQAMQSKLQTARENLTAAEKFLQDSLNVIQAEGSKIKSDLEQTLVIHKNASDVLSKQLGELEETQRITEHNLTKWEQDEKDLRDHNQARHDEMTQLLQSGESRLLQLTTAIMRFESETVKVRERNTALVDQIELGLQKVIQQNLAC